MASTEQTIRSFYIKATSEDFSRDFQFRVAAIRLGNLVLNENDMLYCQSANLPARDVNIVNAKYHGMSFNIPGAAVYPGSSDYSLRFYCDMNSNLRKKFEDETRYVFDDATSTGDYLVPRASSVIDLVQLDTKNNAVAKYKLVGCTIKSVGQLDYKMADGSGDLVSFDVKLAYQWFERDDSVQAVSLNVGGISVKF